MRRAEIIPNYYAYTLKVNGRRLTTKQKKYFFECLNKLYQRNSQVVYRGDKVSHLQQAYDVNNENSAAYFRQSLFIMGAKGGMFSGTELPGASEIDIAEAGGNEFLLIFKMLHNLLRREFPFSALRNGMNSFRERENEFVDFFRSEYNQQRFLDLVATTPQNQRIAIRDYYLALLHHCSKSQYYSSSFLLSTTASFAVAHKFAWKDETTDSSNPLILVGWIPRGYEGVLSTPGYMMVNEKGKMTRLGFPLYSLSFFPNQQEITLKGGLLPHYILGCLRSNHGEEIFDINPAVFQTDESWDGKELPIDQSTFHERIQNTVFARYFSVDIEGAGYTQYRRF